MNTETQGKLHVTMEVDWSVAAASQGMLKTDSIHHKLGRKARNIFSLRVPRRNQLCRQIDFVPPPSKQ